VAIKILVVDDERSIVESLSEILRAEGYEVLSACSPREAIVEASGNCPTLLLSDVLMPGMNGFDLCAKLRTLSAHKLTPVVFVTVHRDVESIARSTVSGGNDFISKPFLDIDLQSDGTTVIRARDSAIFSNWNLHLLRDGRGRSS